MPSRLHHIRRVIASLAAEDRPAFKRIDASSALYDDGAWLTPRVA
jgi:hypothetical protein